MAGNIFSNQLSSNDTDVTLHPQVTKQLGIDNRDVINVEFPTFNVTASLAVKIIDGLSDLTINGTL